MPLLLSIVVGLVLVAATGCASPAAQPSGATSPPAGTAVPPAAPAPSPSVVASPGGQAPVSAPKPIAPNAPAADQNALVAQAVADAAAQTGVASDAIRVIQVEMREWPSSALGCEKPGMGYAQVITPGYRIVLEAGGRTLEYHTDRSRAVLCAG